MNDIQKKELEEAWKKLGDIPVIEEGDKDLLIHLVTDEDFSFFYSNVGTISFPKGTDQLEIWHWFDDLGFSVGNRMNGLDPWSKLVRSEKHIPEEKLLEILENWMISVDMDTLATAVGFIFGGDYYYNNITDKYDFIPNENYGGAFDK
jgi:hypothetical protein